MEYRYRSIVIIIINLFSIEQSMWDANNVWMMDIYFGMNNWSFKTGYGSEWDSDSQRENLMPKIKYITKKSKNIKG